MEDLLQTQIREDCRLALPEGLRDLMSDISRELLRAQPTNLYNFIVDYLEAMLITRETLCIACRVCQDVCKCICYPELVEELQNLGLDREDLDTVKNVVMEYFDKDEVKESNLLMKLFSKTNFDTNLLPDIQDAVREAFQKHLRAQQAERAEAEKAKEGEKAVQHTLQFHERSQEDKELSWDDAATKIQATFRGELERGRSSLDEAAPKLRGKLAQIDSSNTFTQRPVKIQKDEAKASTSKPPIRSNIPRLSLSSTSLAGSLIDLPKYIPYSVHDLTYIDFEERETERKNIDYTLETHLKDAKEEEAKKIAFFEQHVLHDIKSCSIEEEEDIKEHVVEEIISEASSVDENIVEDKIVYNADEELENAHVEDLVADKILSKNIAPIDIEQRLAPDTNTTLESDVGTSKNENTINKALANESTSNDTVEERLSKKETLSDKVKAAFQIKSFNSLNVEKYFEDGYGDEEIETGDYLSMEKYILSSSKDNMEMIQTIKKKNKLSDTAINDEQYSSDD